MTFRVGDLVTLDLDGPFKIIPPKDRLATPFGGETIYRVTRADGKYNGGSQFLWVTPIAQGDKEYGEFNGGRFKQYVGKREEETVDTMRAMTLEVARSQRQRLIESGVDKAAIRIRSRSWDADGSFFAIDVQVPNPTGGTNKKQSLYLPKNVDEFLALQKPEDITPYNTHTQPVVGTKLYQFKVDGIFARAKDGSYWFSLSDLRRTGGIVTINGRRYRVGERKFVPLV